MHVRYNESITNDTLMGAQKMAVTMVKVVLMHLDSAPCSEKDWILRTAEGTVPLHAQIHQN